MSDAVERRILDLLDHPSVSPYGNPIPGLAELDPGASDVVAGSNSARPGIGFPYGLTDGCSSRSRIRRSTASLMTCSQRQASA